MSVRKNTLFWALPKLPFPCPVRNLANLFTFVFAPKVCKSILARGSPAIFGNLFTFGKCQEKWCFFLGRRPYFRNNGVNHVYIDNHNSKENDVKHVQMTNEYRINHCEFFDIMLYQKNFISQIICNFINCR